MKQIYAKDFVPRLTKPTASDKYYCRSWSPCINGSPAAWSGSVLSNCVGYAFGRFCEIGDLSASECKLGKTAGVAWPQGAIEWWENDRSGYAKGQTPKVGACMVFVKKDRAFGHVQIVERVYADGSVLCSRSDWQGSAWYTQTLKPPYTYGSGVNQFIFEGFIYNPAVLDNPDGTTTYTTKTVAEVAQEVINGLWGNGTDRKNAIVAAGYNYSEVQAKVNEILSGKTASTSTATTTTTTTSTSTTTTTTTKSVEEVAKEVINGQWGNGADRKKRLVAAGYDYAAVQAKVNDLLNGKTTTTTTTAAATTTTTTAKTYKFQVGDRVKIVASGSNQRAKLGTKAGGIGWVRYILSVGDGAYPYQVGAQSGATTGFYAENALTKF